MLAQEAVERAYREAAIKTINSPAFTTAELTEGLARLNGFLASLFGAEIGRLATDVQVPVFQRTATNPNADFHQGFPGNLTNTDQPVGAMEQRAESEYIVPPNSRILWRNPTDLTVFLPQYPTDGAQIEAVNTGGAGTLTLDGNGRLVEGANTLVLAPGFAPKRLFYRADLGNWIPLAPLTLTSETPLPPEFDDLLVSGTAIRLTGLDEIEPTAGTMFIFNRLMKRCKERYTQRQSVSPGGQYIPNSLQSYDMGYIGW